MRRSIPSATNHLGVENSHVSICFVSLLLEDDAASVDEGGEAKKGMLSGNIWILVYVIYSVELKPIVGSLMESSSNGNDV